MDTRELWFRVSGEGGSTVTPKKSVRKGTYEFKSSSLVEIRKRLNVSQAAMAELLGVPPNTLSRWETGTTVPDADYLALIYSVAREHNVTPTFFSIRREPQDTRKPRYRLIVMWDFQTLGVPANQVVEADAWLRTEVKRRFGGMTHQLYKAFTFASQSASADILESLGWRVWEDDTDIDEEIIDQSRSDAGQDPGGTILILITRDKGFIDLIDESKRENVRVYFAGPEFPNQELIEKVSRRRWIQWERNDFSLLPMRY